MNSAAALAAWRAAERRRLLDLRQALGADARRSCAPRIAAGLDAFLGEVKGLTIAAYWPVRGEPDLRPWMESISARGAVCVLPVVVATDAPLVFRRWQVGDPLEVGVWSIPVPGSGPARQPDVVITPVVGFDRACHRLGYGGGYFDRTLAALTPRPRAIGVGYAQAAMATIYPQAHDVAMDAIITEIGVVTSSSE